VSVILSLEDVHKSFDTGQTTVSVLRGVSFEMQQGEFVAVMGSSGAGKSTLLYLVAGLEPPTSGSIRLDGQVLTDLSERQLTKLRRRQIGFVFQSYNLLPNLTVRENVALPLVLAGERVSRYADRIDELIGRVGLGHRVRHRPEALSGGEQQRVAIARALLTRPAVILADEPTGNLDSINRRELYRLFRDLAQNDGQTVLMVSHDATGAAMADRVLFLRDGGLVGQMKPEDHDNAQAVAACYQGFMQPPGPDDRDGPGGSL